MLDSRCSRVTLRETVSCNHVLMLHRQRRGDAGFFGSFVNRSSSLRYSCTLLHPFRKFPRVKKLDCSIKQTVLRALGFRLQLFTYAIFFGIPPLREEARTKLRALMSRVLADESLTKFTGCFETTLRGGSRGRGFIKPRIK